MRDALTGGFNRRHLMDTIRAEKQRSDRSGRPSSICILDIDFFKNVNDIADFTRDEETSATFQRADDAVYRAKQTGRNRCVVTPGTAQPGEPRAD